MKSEVTVIIDFYMKKETFPRLKYELKITLIYYQCNSTLPSVHGV